MRPTLFGMLTIATVALGACGHEFDYEGEGAAGKADTVWAEWGDSGHKFAFVDACTDEDESPAKISIKLSEICKQPDEDDEDEIEEYFGDKSDEKGATVGCEHLKGKCFPSTHRGRVYITKEKYPLEKIIEARSSTYWQHTGPHYVIHNDDSAKEYELSVRLAPNRDQDPVPLAYEAGLLGLRVIRGGSTAAELKANGDEEQRLLFDDEEDETTVNVPLYPGQTVRVLAVSQLDQRDNGGYAPYVIEFSAKEKDLPDPPERDTQPDFRVEEDKTTFVTAENRFEVWVCNDGAEWSGKNLTVAVADKEKLSFDEDGTPECIKPEKLDAFSFVTVAETRVFGSTSCQKIPIDNIRGLNVDNERRTAVAIVDPTCTIEKNGEDFDRSNNFAETSYRIRGNDDPKVNLYVDLTTSKEGDDGILFKGFVSNSGSERSQLTNLMLYVREGELASEKPIEIPPLGPDDNPHEFSLTKDKLAKGSYKPYALLEQLSGENPDGNRAEGASIELAGGSSGTTKPDPKDPVDPGSTSDKTNLIKIESFKATEKSSDTKVAFSIKVCNKSGETMDDGVKVWLYYDRDKKPTCDDGKPDSDDGKEFTTDKLAKDGDDACDTLSKTHIPKKGKYTAWVLAGCELKDEELLDDNVDDASYTIKEATSGATERDDGGDDETKSAKKLNRDDEERASVDADDCSIGHGPTPAPGLHWLMLIAAVLLRQRRLRLRWLRRKRRQR